MYFNYHAKIKKLIKENHAVGFEFLEEYHNISPCILIYFDSVKPLPIREHRFEEYMFLFAKYDVKEIKK